jgi:hypothetical protein
MNRSGVETKLDMMNESEKNSLRAFVRHWQRVGPLLEEVRRRELRELGNGPCDPLVESLLELGEIASKSQPQTTSGLVEQQRRFRKLWGQ